MDDPLDAATLAALASAYQQRWGIGLWACRPDGALVWGEAPEADDHAPSECAVRALAIAEALRWGDPSFELTPGERLIWAVPLMHNAQVRGGLVAAVTARLSAGRDGLPLGVDLNAAAADLRRLAEEANVTNAALLEAQRVAEGRERTRAEAIHALKALPHYDLRQMFLLEEPALAAAVRRGDRGEARAVLNRLLVGIHSCAGDRLDLVKSFYAELVVTVSRTAVYAGGAPEEILPANLVGLARLAAIADEQSLAHWLREMLEQAMDAVRAGRRAGEATLIDALAWLRDHFTEDITRDDVARAGHLSPAHFSRQVRRRLGCTFTALLTALRLDLATELLVRTDKQIGLIALECGFGDQSYFTKVFRGARGVTPRSYRAALLARGRHRHQ